MQRGVLIKQTILISASAALFFAFRGAESSVAALYGGFTAIANVQLLLWRKRRAERALGLGAQPTLRALYLSALERFGLVIALIALGMGWLGLDPLALLTGFMVGQATVLLLWTEPRQQTKA